VLALSKRWKTPEKQYKQWYKQGEGFALGAVQFVKVESDLRKALAYDVGGTAANIFLSTGTAGMLTAAGIATVPGIFIGAGSQAEYGAVQCPLTENTPVHPQSGYGIAKYAAGRLSALLCTQLDIRHNWLRILSVYGPNDAPYTLISYVINELQNGQSPELTKCEQVWDYLYADDAAQAILAVAQKGIHGKTYPLGSGTACKLSEYVNIIRDYVNPDIAIRFGAKEYYPHQPMFLQADITELTKDTGWKPETPFLEGVKKVCNVHSVTTECFDGAKQHKNEFRRVY